MKYTILSLIYYPRFCENNRFFSGNYESDLMVKPRINSRGENQPTSPNTSFVAALRRLDSRLEQEEWLNANLVTKMMMMNSIVCSKLRISQRLHLTVSVHFFVKNGHFTNL